MRSTLASLLGGAALLVSALAPHSAMAATTGPTMVVTLRAFPSGAAIPSQLNGTVQLTPSGPVTLAAPAQAFSGTSAYNFLFWNLTSDIGTTPTVSFTAPADSSTFAATAWYLPQGGGGPGTPGVSTFAFSMNNDQVISGTPIASVTPASAWVSPATFVPTTGGAVSITARSLIGGYGLFNRWFQQGIGVSSSTVLSAPANASRFAIAFYGIPVPDPCEGDRNALDSLSPGDFLTLTAYQKAKAQLTKQLLSCEHQWGEI